MTPSIYFISGWSFGGEVWESVAQKYDNVRFLEWSKAVKDSNYIRDSMQDGKNIVVGWSLGAMCAMEAFNVGADISALLLISPSARMVRDVAYFGVSNAVLESMKEGVRMGDSSILEGFSKNVAYPLEPSLKPCEFEQGELVQGLSYLQGFDMRGGMSEIDVPVSIVHGVQDRIVPISQGRAVADSVKRARFVSVEGAGHDLFSAHYTVIIDELDRLLCDI